MLDTEIADKVHIKQRQYFNILIYFSFVDIFTIPPLPPFLHLAHSTPVQPYKSSKAPFVKFHLCAHMYYLFTLP